MNTLRFFGLTSLAVGLCFAACSDDSEPGSMGSGGSAGTGGAGGRGGMAGRGGGAMTAGGAGGAGGSGMTAAPCSGCVELRVPYTEGGQRAGFAFVLPEPGVDLSQATVTWRLQVPTNNADAYVQGILQNLVAPNYPGNYDTYQSLATGVTQAGQWFDFVVNAATIPGLTDAGLIGSDPGATVDGGPLPSADAGVPTDAGAEPAPAPLTAFDKSRVTLIALQTGSVATPTTPTGVVTLFVDSVTFTGVAGFPDKTFTMGADDLVLNMGGSTAGLAATITHHP